jgi:hypothetical protein
MRVRDRLLRLLAPALLLCACQTYDSRFAFEPAPHGTTVTRKDNDEAAARVLASVVGVRRADSDTQRPREIETRVRVENVGQEPITFDPQSLVLVTADLVELQPTLVEPPSIPEIPPGGDATVTAYFPVPGGGGSYDARTLAGLDMRWHLRIGARPVSGNSQFRMRADAYYASYYYYPYPSYYGYPYHHPWHYPYYRRRGRWYW